MKQIVIVILSFISFHSSADSIWNEPSVWEQMQVPEVKAKNFPELNSSGLPEDIQVLILEGCQNSAKEAKEFTLKGRSNDYRIQEISQFDQIKQLCSGRVGETFCKHENLEKFLANCSHDRLANARIEQAIGRHLNQ